MNGQRQETIKWHQDCAENASNYIKSKEAEIEAEVKRLHSSLDNIKKEHHLYLLQIQTAIENGEVKFNRAKYK